MRYKQTFDLANFTVLVTDEPKLHIQRCKKVIVILYLI